jgi:hypothetical protein
MAAHHRPTDEDRRSVIEIALSCLARGDCLGDTAARLAPLHPRHNTFPGEVLLDLAADAIEVSGATRQSPIEFEGIRDRYLPEAIAHTKAQHHKSKYALRAAAMLRGGVDPGLLDGVQWWRSDDLWYWSLEALASYIRVAADSSPSPSKPSAGGSPTSTASRPPARPDPEPELSASDPLRRVTTQPRATTCRSVCAVLSL